MLRLPSNTALLVLFLGTCALTAAAPSSKDDSGEIKTSVNLLDVLGSVVTIIVTMRGFSAARTDSKADNEALRVQSEATNKALREELMDAISKRTVSLEEYKLKVRETHGELNATREQLIAQKALIEQLQKEISNTNAVIAALTRGK